ncbi:MAG: DUF933 domain-containing protein [Spirochaetota bacterium]
MERVPGLKLGMVGLPQSGKRTVFSLLTGSDYDSLAGEHKKNVQGVAGVRDGRFSELVKMHNPKKVTPAQLSIELLPDLDPQRIKDGEVYHVKGSVDAGRDMDLLYSEFVLHDLLFIEKRLARIEQGKKKGREEDLDKEKKLMERLGAQLENDLPLSTCQMDQDEWRIISGYPFITLKELIVLLNVGDSDLLDDSLENSIRDKYSDHGIEVMRVSAALESEIASLDDPQERAVFMEESGIQEPAIDLLTRKSMKALGLESFFTVGEDEVRQWLIPANCPAPEAASVIHSDIQRGFIRAEVMKYDDLVGLGSEEAVKAAGKFLTAGKDYIVQDGDVISFRFNV